MAKLYNDFKSDNLMSFGKSFSRLNGQPLDKSETWFSFVEAQAYARTDAAYVGQKIAVIDNANKKVTHYSIENVDGDLKEIGSGANVQIDVDTTLSQEGQAADAKAVGEEIDRLEELIRSGSSGSSDLEATDDGQGNVTLSSVRVIESSDDGQGNVTITM